MPRLGLVCGIVVNSHGDDELRRENSHTSTDRDPAEDIDCTAAIALIVNKVRMLLSVPMHCCVVLPEHDLLSLDSRSTSSGIVLQPWDRHLQAQPV